MTYRVAIDGLLSEFHGGEALLLNLGTRRYHRLNPTAAFVWTLLEKQPLDCQGIARALVSKYDVTEERAEASAARFIGDLAAQGLVAPV